AVNSRRSPNRVVTTHGSNQIARLPRNTGTPRPAVTNLPSPVPLKSLTMPTDHGFRFDDDQGRAPTRPQAWRAKPKDLDQLDRGRAGLSFEFAAGQSVDDGVR